MNSLVFLDTEQHGTEVAIQGARCVEIRERHRLVAGEEILAVCSGGDRYRAMVNVADESGIRLKLSVKLPPFAQLPVRLVVGICRPPSIRKVVQIAASVGVESLHFVRSERGEKSYLNSTALLESELTHQCLLAIEQVGGGVPPQIKCHQFFRPFVEDVLGQAEPGEMRVIGAIAHGRPLGGYLTNFSGVARVTLAIGGERGWNEHEESAFREVGFQTVSLGERMYRIEHATAFLIGQVMSEWRGKEPLEEGDKCGSEN